ncbi:EAL domain-containing protein [Bradyrhizobium jicamae]|uniref:bifunctional diguanylate cyclase/phosphodiesterase n=1 Tax=Bradyrhizobium jicamae TaxID=280332 RepID=UPI001BA74974|nr:EAL domain-containing protein [Bradyrhizobium jicamae]MBR0751516.1 EAL domain-containing protein [Bradyrhizobium jicamae]
MQGLTRWLARSPGSPIAVLGIVLSLSTIVLFVTDLEVRYLERIASAKTDAKSFARILAEHTELTFDDVDRVLFEAQAIRTRSLSAGSAGLATANVALRQLQSSSSVLVAIGWTDASGNLIAHSYPRTPPLTNIADREHFIAQRNATDDRLFVSPPYRSVATNKWYSAATRRLSNPDGSFAGVVSAAIDQTYFTKIYRSINLGKSGSVVLLHREGRILARQPEIREAIGKSFADAPLLTEYLPKSESGTFETVSVVDGVERIAGYQAVDGMPLVLIVTYARAEVLAPWYRHLYTYGLLVLTIVSFILFGTYLLVRQTNRLAAQSRALQRTNTRFDVAISNMNQGLCLFDADKNLVISNGRYQEMYSLPDRLVRPGTPLQDILQFYKDRGESSTLTVDQHVQLMPTQREQNFELADRREIFIQRKALPDGGWVATHEDITEQKRAERLIAEKAIELEAMNVRFDAALSNMSHGLALFDADQKVVVANARYAEMYQLSPDQVRRGTLLAQILDYRRNAGTHFIDVTPETYLAHNIRDAKEVRECADGRIIAIARAMMPDGGWLTTHEDITERARNEKRIVFLAQHDQLTGLANRAVFSDKLAEASRRLQRHGSTFTVLMLDLDKFKAVNDTLGHQAGDQLLVEVAQRLTSSLRDTDVLARLGGDEFAIIQENEKDQREGAIGLARRIIGLIEQPFVLNGHRVHVGTSIGIAFAPEHATEPEVLLHDADVALYAAKSGGRNDYRIYRAEFAEAADQQKSLEAELRDAIAHGEFELRYQPFVDARSRAVRGAEAFVRWQHPTKGLLAPDQFLPLAESTGLILPLGAWILREACRRAAAWPAPLRVAVNVSAAQFDAGNLFEVVLGVLTETGLSPDRLELEIPDGALLHGDQDAYLRIVRLLKNAGITIVLDSCGYSAASSLTGLPFDKIKIDKPIVQGMASRRDCAAVVSSIRALAQGLDIVTAAKGVESADQYEALLAAGVDVVQGYLFGQPVPHDTLDFGTRQVRTRNVA